LIHHLDISELISKNGTSVQCVALCNTERKKIRFMKNQIKPMQEGKNFQMVLDTNEMRTIQ
jgi:hypothetical protein